MSEMEDKLNARQRWAVKFCLKVLDTVHWDERVSVLAVLIEMHIRAVADAALALTS